MPLSEIGTYPAVGVPNYVTQLQWNDNILATAGGDSVRLWDIRYNAHQVPIQELRHEGVKGLEVSPMQRNVLATGGTNGIQLWNLQSGSLRATIPTPDPVTSLSWSPYRPELMASYGKDMAIWSLASQVHRLAEWGLVEDDGEIGGNILSLDSSPNTDRVLSIHACGRIALWDPFGAAPQVPKNRVTPRIGMLDLQVLR
jgi:WD40 repeat protein